MDLRNLPLEVAQQIFQFLTFEELGLVSNCLPEWSHLINDDYFWSVKCKNDGYKDAQESERSEIYKKILQKYPHHWQGVYNYNYVLRQNWKKSNFIQRIINFPKMHYSLHYFDDEIIIFTAVTNEVIVYDYNSEMVKRVFRLICEQCARKSSVIKSQNFLIYFGCSDHWYVWNLDTDACQLYTGDIKTVVTHNNIAALIYVDNFCKVINMDSAKFEYESPYVSCVCFGDNIVAFGRFDGTINIMNMNYQLLTTLDCDEKGRVDNIIIRGEKLISFCISGIGLEVCLSNIKTSTNLYKFYRRCNWGTSMFIDENTFTLPDGRYTLSVLDFNTGTCRCFLENSDTIIYAMLNSFLILIVDGNSKNINTWCKKTKKFFSKLKLECTLDCFHNPPRVTNTKMIYTIANPIRQSNSFVLLNFEANIDYDF